MNRVMGAMAMLILHKAEEHTACIQVDPKQGFQKCSFKSELPIVTSVTCFHVSVKSCPKDPAPEYNGAGKQEIPKKTRRPAASSGAIPTRENPRVTRPGIEQGSARWEASSLTAQTPWPRDKIDVKHLYTIVDFAIGLQFIRHALDDSEPIADVQGNNSEPSFAIGSFELLRVPICLPANHGRDLQARLYSFMHTYADVNNASVVCCHSGRRRLGQRSPGSVKHRADQRPMFYEHKCLKFYLASKGIREFLRSQLTLHNAGGYTTCIQDKLDVQHVYIEISFAIGSQFIRHTLDNTEPIADLLDSTVLCTNMPMSTMHWLPAVTVEGDDWASILQEMSNTDKIDEKHLYTIVDFAIGLQFISHALDDSEPITDVQGNNGPTEITFNDTIAEATVMSVRLYIEMLEIREDFSNVLSHGIRIHIDPVKWGYEGSIYWLAYRLMLLDSDWRARFQHVSGQRSHFAGACGRSSLYKPLLHLCIREYSLPKSLNTLKSAHIYWRPGLVRRIGKFREFNDLCARHLTVQDSLFVPLQVYYWRGVVQVQTAASCVRCGIMQQLRTELQTTNFLVDVSGYDDANLRLTSSSCVNYWCSPLLAHSGSVAVNFTVVYAPELASFFHWLLRRCQATPFLTELNVIDVRNCDVFNYKRSRYLGRVRYTKHEELRRAIVVVEFLANDIYDSGIHNVESFYFLLRKPPGQALAQATRRKGFKENVNDYVTIVDPSHVQFTQKGSDLTSEQQPMEELRRLEYIQYLAPYRWRAQLEFAGQATISSFTTTPYSSEAL
ncbi:hypothetical protein PR048_033549 [Dryococelus australis]|uniref:Uncharacterized protein n=1 Tax=Dryococelus australis TaxID=614101 RepID=A0ABQ9G0L3_9NEOP|nr:hypothetical protein PR048_033549 [Dryococelus australis]